MKQSDVVRFLEEQGEDIDLIRRVEFGISHYTIERGAKNPEGKQYMVWGDLARTIVTKPYEPETTEEAAS